MAYLAASCTVMPARARFFELPEELEGDVFLRLSPIKAVPLVPPLWGGALDAG